MYTEVDRIDGYLFSFLDSLHRVNVAVNLVPSNKLGLRPRKRWHALQTELGMSINVLYIPRTMTYNWGNRCLMPGTECEIGAIIHELYIRIRSCICIN